MMIKSLTERFWVDAKLKAEEYLIMSEMEDRHFWFISRRRVVEGLLKRAGLRAPTGLILDAGCGTGFNLEYFSAWGETLGVEKAAAAIPFLKRRRRPWVMGDVQELPFAADTFDLALSLDVLYHAWVEDDHKALRETLRVLKPGGVLALTTPALDFLWRRHDQAMLTARRYRRRELKSRLENAGFLVEKISYYFMCLFPPVLQKKLGEGLLFPAKSASDFSMPPKWLNDLIIGICSLEAQLFEWINLPVGVSLVCLARKRPS